MKTFIFIVVSFIFPGNINAQQKKDVYSIVPMQAGTINLSSKGVNVELTDEVKNILNNKTLSASYYVIFTPIDNAIILSISNKSSKGFVILPQLSSNAKTGGTADYIIYVKRKVVQLSIKKPDLNKPTHE